jgi:phage baseplate assembly protein gpV
VSLPTFIYENEWADGATGSMSDRVLRVGEVVQALSPSSPGNSDPGTKGKQWVYIVNVDWRDYDGSRQLVPFRCTVMDGFGGRADHVRHTVRATDVPSNNLFSVGDQVLVLCINGDKSNALIVGGLRHREDNTVDPDTTFYDFLFNGVHFAIDVDGQVLMEVPGATKPNGKPDPNRDANNHGSLVRFAKDGTITVSDENGESIRVSPGSKLIEVKSSDVTIICTKDVNVTAQGKVSVQAEGNADFGGAKTYVGAAGANESLVLGNKLATALRELVTIFLTNAPRIGFPTPIGPIPLNPTVVAALLQWTAKYGIPDGLANPILSATKFTEK